MGLECVLIDRDIVKTNVIEKSDNLKELWDLRDNIY
jgi:hypothetical protein